jgi:hypothetical protein
MSRRARKGALKGLGKFIPLPVEAAKAASCASTAPEFRVYVCIAAQCQPWSNGTAMLVRPVIKEWKLGSFRTVASAVRKLLAAGLIVRTRKATQHKAALYGVTHLPLNLDALAKAGVSATTWEALEGASSATNSGSTAALPHGKRYRYQRGSAEGAKQATVLPHGKRWTGFSGVPALPHGNTSKNLPATTAEKCAADDAPKAAAGGVP